MSIEDLLKYANDKKPGSFNKEFNKMLAERIKEKLQPPTPEKKKENE